jgi:anti-sigma B factor antagonist
MIAQLGWLGIGRVVMYGEYAARLEGELEAANVGPFLKQWLAAAEEQQPARFAIDMSAVTFIDSTALGAIARVHNQLLRHGGELVIVNAADRIVRLLQITGMDRVIEVNATKRTSHAT